MAWQRITWVEKETKLGPTNLNRIEAGIDAGYPKFGTRAARPLAADANHGWTYVATDQAATYISDGATWHRTGLPAGLLGDFPLNVQPTGWVVCAGQEVPRDGIYADLFAFLATTHGAGDGLTTFNLPDFRGRVRVGRDDMNGVPANRVPSATSSTTAGGSDRVTLTGQQSGVRDHGHSVDDRGHGHNSFPFAGGQFVSYTGTSDNAPIVAVAGAGHYFRIGGGAVEGNTTGISVNGSGNADAAQSHDNMPPYKPVTTCIKL